MRDLTVTGVQTCALPISQIERRPEVQSALSRTLGIFMPSAAQGSDGRVTITLGAKGVIECELVASGERWGRGPRKDIHSSNKARVDSPEIGRASCRERG